MHPSRMLQKINSPKMTGRANPAAVRLANAKDVIKKQTAAGAVVGSSIWELAVAKARWPTVAAKIERKKAALVLQETVSKMRKIADARTKKQQVSLAAAKLKKTARVSET